MICCKSGCKKQPLFLYNYTIKNFRIILKDMVYFS